MPHTKAVTPKRRCRDNESVGAVGNSVGSNVAAEMLGWGKLVSLGSQMADEVGMTQRPMMSSSRLRMQEMGTQLGGQNRVEGMETGPQEWEWLTMSL
jgi:hypothetical protein